NLDGTFLGCKAGVAAMKARGGSIVNVASMLALRAGDDFPAYCASKGGVRMLSKSVALHCARSGYPVRVNTLFPGAILTSMVEGYVAAGEAQGASREDVLSVFRAAHPMGRIGEAEEAAKAVLYLASDDSSFTTGAELTVDGGGSI
ncbi:MAG: SDR family oxidoreductase, partial [Pseudomonadota bacterium]